MKRTFITLILCTAAFAGFSQTLSYGIKAGFNLSWQAINNNSYHLVNYQDKPGFNAGFIADINFGNISIQPALTFTTKGFISPMQVVPLSNQNEYVAPRVTYGLNYLQLNANVVYNLKTSSMVTLQMGAGPYYADGISAHYNNRSVDFGNNYKNPDAGIGFIAGAKIGKHVLANVSYDLGLSNLSVVGGNIKNRVAGVSLVYLLR
ncbi:MAG: porin family protein [Mucilaginibacter sp.]